MSIVSATTANADIAIIELKGALIGGEETDELRSAVTGLLEQGNKKLVIDMGKVNYLNSTAIGALVGAHTSYLNRQGRLVLCNVGKGLTNVFVITKLVKIFQIEEGRTEAILVLT